MDVWQCPARSGARSGGPVVAAEIWSLKEEGEEGERIGKRRKEGRKEERRQATLIKTRDPHQAGGEKIDQRVL